MPPPAYYIRQRLHAAPLGTALPKPLRIPGSGAARLVDLLIDFGTTSGAFAAETLPKYHRSR